MMKSTILLAALLTACCAEAADWPMWGGSADRNMVNAREKQLPSTWDIDAGRGVKWAASLGSQSYGNPVVADGRVFVGTNNEGRRDAAIEGDKGVVMCFRESDGEFLWQAVHDKLSAGRVNDWPLQGICSAPAVDGERLYYVNNRCELVCADVAGFHDGRNDGPVTNEVYTGKRAADIVWRYDMIEELGVFPHNLATSSPVVAGDLVLLLTGNGVDEGHLNLPSPRAPSFIAVNKATGALAWEFGDVGQILHGQWSSPAVGVVAGKSQAIFPGGDGYVYALEPETGKLIWKFNCNPADSVWELGGYGTKNNLISTPVIYRERVYIGVGQDPEHGTGIGHLWCIGATGRGDVTDTHARWHLGGKDFGRTMSTVSVAGGLLYVCDLAGILYCIDARTGAVAWTHDLMAAVWGSTMLADDKIYVGDEDGDMAIFKHGPLKKVIAELNMGSTVYTTPTAANGVLFIATKSTLYALRGGP